MFGDGEQRIDGTYLKFAQKFVHFRSFIEHIGTVQIRKQELIVIVQIQSTPIDYFEPVARINGDRETIFEFLIRFSE